MSTYKSLIDQAMETARYRLEAGSTTKTASATVSNTESMLKEASEIANALEYVAINTADDGTTAGSARAEIVRDFFKSATAERFGQKLAGDVGEAPTQASGPQGQVPESGKTRLHKLLSGPQGNPLVSSGPNTTGKTMLESYKQADSGQTLYDILMTNKEASDHGGPMVSDSSMPAQGIPSSNENSNRAILNDAYVLEGVSKREAKEPVRARLAEAFAGTTDTLGDASAKAVFPQATAKGGLKKTAGVSQFMSQPLRKGKGLLSKVSRGQAATLAGGAAHYGVGRKLYKDYQRGHQENELEKHQRKMQFVGK